MNFNGTFPSSALREIKFNSFVNYIYHGVDKHTLVRSINYSGFAYALNSISLIKVSYDLPLLKGRLKSSILRYK